MNAVREWFQRKLRRGDIGVGWAKTSFNWPWALLLLLLASRLMIAGMQWSFPWPECREAVLQVVWGCDVCVILGCFASGIFAMRRKGVFGVLPGVDEQWLASTPFADKYIFSGPVFPHLAVDLSLIGMIPVAIQLTGAAPAGLAIVAYLAGMLGNSCRILAHSEERWGWYAAAFCLTISPSVLIGLGWLPSAVLLGLCNALIASIVRRAFSRGVLHHWTNIAVTPRREMEVWPYCELHGAGRQSKQLPQPLYGWMLAILGAATAFSTVFVLESFTHAQPPPHPGETRESPVFLVWIVWVITALGLAVLRCVAYVHRCHPPLTLLGRLFQGKWIIPRYDIVFITPLSLVLVLMLTVISSFFVPSLLALPLGVFVVWMLLCFGPPDWKTWRLTAPVRIGEPPEPKNTEPPYQRL